MLNWLQSLVSFLRALLAQSCVTDQLNKTGLFFFLSMSQHVCTLKSSCFQLPRLKISPCSHMPSLFMLDLCMCVFVYREFGHCAVQLPSALLAVTSGRGVAYIICYEAWMSGSNYAKAQGTIYSRSCIILILSKP